MLNTRNKFKKICTESNQNKISLEKKSNDTVRNNLPSFFQNPSILYDSGWIVPGVIDGNIISGNSDIYFNTGGSPEQEEIKSFSLTYNFYTTLNIAEKFVAFIKPVILFKKSSDVEVIEDLIDNRGYQYQNYFKIEGDGTKIYQGYYPNLTQFPDSEQTLGNFDVALASKYYYGILKWNSLFSGNSYELTNSYICKIVTMYDCVLVPGMGYSYKQFTCEAIDTISSSSVTGTGEYKVHDANTGITTTTLNVTMSAIMFNASTIIYASGHLYINGSFIYSYSITNPYMITFDTYDNILSSFSYTWTSIDDTRYWKLFYSDKRATVFGFGNDVLTNLPVKSSYQDNVLPYTHLYVTVNPSGYPTSVQNTRSTGYSSASKDRKCWMKITDNQFKFTITGTLILLGLFKNNISTTVTYIIDSYNISGSTYIRISNRPDKSANWYIPNLADLKIRLMLVLQNPLTDNTEQNQTLIHE